MEKGNQTTMVKPQALNPFLPKPGVSFPLNDMRKSLNIFINFAEKTLSLNL